MVRYHSPLFHVRHFCGTVAHLQFSLSRTLSKTAFRASCTAIISICLYQALFPEQIMSLQLLSPEDTQLHQSEMRQV